MSETGAANKEARSDQDKPTWSIKKALLILALVAAGLGIMSELVTDAIQPAAAALGFTPIFAGIF
jgi:Ca2+:H+ antiporter